MGTPTLQALARLVYQTPMTRIFDIKDCIRLTERFFGMRRTVLAQL